MSPLHHICCLFARLTWQNLLKMAKAPAPSVSPPLLHPSPASSINILLLLLHHWVSLSLFDFPFSFSFSQCGAYKVPCCHDSKRYCQCRGSSNLFLTLCVLLSHTSRLIHNGALRWLLLHRPRCLVTSMYLLVYLVCHLETDTCGLQCCCYGNPWGWASRLAETPQIVSWVWNQIRERFV